MDEAHYRLLKLLEVKPHLSQRELSRDLGVSLGKINYCLAALIGKGWIKVRNFRNNRDKLSYAYLLTPSGIVEIAALTANFLRRKMVEYDVLKQEIEELKREVEGLSS